MDALKAQNALMTGQARFEKGKREFERKWQLPMQRAQLRAAWQMMPAEVKEKLKQQNPEGYAQVEKFLQEPA